ncbi:MAG: hypothetical protein PHP17_01155 [Candidatus Omnitrophica bacterium]|nr:hypothetical protein [Candidatus Omnitrophota bacterium]
MKILMFSLGLLVFSCFMPHATFAEYASESIGNEVTLHGPYSWQRLGVALDKKIGDDLIYAYRMRDKTAFMTLLNSYDVLRVTKDTKVIVLDTETLKGRAHVAILTGFYKGMSGWVPVEWLKGNGPYYLSKEGGEESKI